MAVVMELIHNQQKQGRWEESFSSLRAFLVLDPRTLEDNMRATMMKGRSNCWIVSVQTNIDFLARYFFWKGDATEAKRLVLIVLGSKRSKKNVWSYAETLLRNPRDSRSVKEEKKD